MSAANIRQAIEDIALDALGADFKTHSTYFDVEGNSDRNLNNGVSVLWGDMSELPDRVSQCLSVTQDFAIKITVRGFPGIGDEKSVSKVDAVYSSVNDILKRCVHDKLDKSDLVNEVRLRGVNAPVPFNNQQRDIVKIEIGLTVSYIIP